MKTRMQDIIDNMIINIPRAMILGVAVGITLFMIK